MVNVPTEFRLQPYSNNYKRRNPKELLNETLGPEIIRREQKAISLLREFTDSG